MKDFTILPKELFFRKDEETGEYIQGFMKEHKDNRILLFYEFLNYRRLKNNKVEFTLDFLIQSCGYKVNHNKGRSLDIFKGLINLFMTNEIIKNLKYCFEDKPIKDISTILPKDYISCDMEAVEGNFILLYRWEKDKILSCDKEGVDNVKMLIYYCYLKSRMYIRSKQAGDRVISGGRNEVAYPSYEDICKQIDIAKNSINKYNKVLDELNMIRYGCAGLFKNTKDKSIVESRNTYILYKDGWKEDLKDAIEFYKEQMKEKGYEFISSLDNKEKSETKKTNGYINRINQLEKAGKATPDQLIKRDEHIKNKLKRKDNNKYGINSKLLH